MARNKFTLTNDLVKIEPEPVVQQLEQTLIVEPLPLLDEMAIKGSEEKKEQLNLKITKKIKKDFQIWCIQNNKSMSDVIETLLKEHVEHN